MTEITVRLVPHSYAKDVHTSFSEAPSQGFKKAFKPNKVAMRRAIKRINEQALAGIVTELDRVSITLNKQEAMEMFGEVSLKTHTTTSTDIDSSITLNEEYQSPTEALKIPDSLKDSIAFAYVPRPAEFFAPSSIPPIEDIYHLRLSDVQIALNAPRCHRNGWTGQGIKVAMADSGFFLHPWFIRQGARIIPTESPGSGAADQDASGHGTGEAANIFTIAPDCTVYGVKTGSSSASTLETCIGLKPDIMTNSWGYSIDNKTREELHTTDPNMYLELIDIENVIASAIDKGITVLFSAGNGHLAFPASIPEVIAVGGVTINEDNSLEASSYASAFDSQLYPGRSVPDVCGIVGRSETSPQSAHIMLPVPEQSRLDGENFPSGIKRSGWGIFSGTSAACPQAAGLVALLKQIDNSLNPFQIKQILEARSIDVIKGTTATGKRAKRGVDLATGAGLIDALRACGYIAPTV